VTDPLVSDDIERLARAYFKLLTAIDWDDAVLVAGLREGLNKFLSNAHLAQFRGRNKYHKTHFITEAARSRVETDKRGGLIWEHLVPKTVYVQEPCEREARRGTLTVEFVRERLQKSWCLATVTVEEDRRLSRLKMPLDWDGVNVRARHESMGIHLIPNPYFEAPGQVASEIHPELVLGRFVEPPTCYIRHAQGATTVVGPIDRRTTRLEAGDRPAPMWYKVRRTRI
jgi:hypothetical protein